MDLSTTYLGLRRCPIRSCPARGPMADRPRHRPAPRGRGAAAIVMRLALRGQIALRGGDGVRRHRDARAIRAARPGSLLPERGRVRARPRRRTWSSCAASRTAVGVPVIGSLNGSHARRLAALRAPDGGGRRRRARAQRLHARDGCDGGRAHASRTGRSTMVREVRQRRLHPARRQAVAVLHVVRELRASARRRGTCRPGALQPLLAARHRRRGARGAAGAAPVRLLRAAAAAAVARDPLRRQRARRARRHGWRPHRHSTSIQAVDGRCARRADGVGAPPPWPAAPRRRSGRSSRSGSRRTSIRRSARCAAA